MLPHAAGPAGRTGSSVTGAWSPEQRWMKGSTPTRPTPSSGGRGSHTPAGTCCTPGPGGVSAVQPGLLPGTWQHRAGGGQGRLPGRAGAEGSAQGGCPAGREWGCGPALLGTSESLQLPAVHRLALSWGWAGTERAEGRHPRWGVGSFPPVPPGPAPLGSSCDRAQGTQR